MSRIIFFDGPCRLCNAFVRLILKIDRSQQFKFSSLQSTTAQRLLTKQDLGLNSVIYYDGVRSVSKSTAVLAILKELGGIYSFLATVLSFIPRHLRDAVYDFIAHHRHQFFGEDMMCEPPPPETADRFLN